MHRAQALLDAGWIWPAYIRNGVVSELARRLRDAPADARQGVLEAALPALYPPEDLAVMLVERYRVTPIVRDFQASIGDAIEAAQLGLLHAAVATLFTVVEGIIRRIATSRGGDVGDGTRHLVTEVDEMIAHERAHQPEPAADRGTEIQASNERIQMLESFRNVLRDRLLTNTRRFDGARELNRHGVLHGVFVNFGHEANFYVLVSILDLLTFMMAFRTSGISVLAPDRTNESGRIAAYYRSLRQVAGTARAVGARR